MYMNLEGLVLAYIPLYVYFYMFMYIDKVTILIVYMNPNTLYI